MHVLVQFPCEHEHVRTSRSFTILHTKFYALSSCERILFHSLTTHLSIPILVFLADYNNFLLKELMYNCMDYYR